MHQVTTLQPMNKDEEDEWIRRIRLASGTKPTLSEMVPADEAAPTPVTLAAEVGTLLVPVSPQASLAAVPYAISLGQATGARVVFLYVHDGRPTKEEMSTMLRRLVRQTRRSDVDGSAMVLSGPLEEVVTWAADRVDADLVVLSRPEGSERSQRIEDSLLDSDPALPVLVVPEVVRVDAAGGEPQLRLVEPRDHAN